MTFEKKMMFLGLARNEMKDGAYYGVTLFDPDSKAPVVVNMMESDDNKEKVDFMEALDCGEVINVRFRIQPKDKLYRLQIRAVS